MPITSAATGARLPGSSAELQHQQSRPAAAAAARPAAKARPGEAGRPLAAQGDTRPITSAPGRRGGPTAAPPCPLPPTAPPPRRYPNAGKPAAPRGQSRLPLNAAPPSSARRCRPRCRPLTWQRHRSALGARRPPAGAGDPAGAPRRRHRPGAGSLFGWAASCVPPARVNNPPGAAAPRSVGRSVSRSVGQSYRGRVSVCASPPLCACAFVCAGREVAGGGGTGRSFRARAGAVRVCPRRDAGLPGPRRAARGRAGARDRRARTCAVAVAVGPAGTRGASPRPPASPPPPRHLPVLSPTRPPPPR